MGIHNYERMITKSLSRLERSKVSLSNKRVILDYFNYLRASGMSKARIDRYLSVLKDFGSIISKDFCELDKKDIIELVGIIESRDYTSWTKSTYKSMFKRFITWIHGSDVPPSCVSWVKVTCKHSKRLPEEILTQEEILRLINASINPRDKALVSTLYESGCRIGELGNLKLKHVSFDKFGAVLLVDGKTGQRRVRIISSVSYLAEWLNRHPLHNNPEAYLWASLGHNHDLLDYQRIRFLISDIAKRAGVTKRVNPHSFRHARATHLCNHLTEAQMKECFGWVQGSSMASVYIHLSGRDVDKVLLKINGINVPDDDCQRDITLVYCSRCGVSNAPTNKYCCKCGLVLDVKEAVELEQKAHEKDRLLNILINDPDVKRLLIEKAKELNNG